jgi:PAS domain S-box-containing protein
MEKLILTSQEGIVATDKKMKVVIYNPSAEVILGYEPETVINKKRAMDLFPKEVMRLYVARKHDSKSIKKLQWREIQVRDKNGIQIPVRFTGTFLYEKNNIMGSVAFMQDLREIKRLEKELLRSERLATIGQTVAGMAHSVKNILHGFKGGNYLMEIGFKKDDTEKLKAGWDMIQKNIRQTSELVMDLLSFSKERPPEYEPCRPNDIARDVCEILKETAHEHNVRILKDLDPAIGQVRMDPRSVHNILMNLASNAVDACIFDENIDKSRRVILKTVLEENGVVRFEVKDNGVGMTPDVQEKIFTSFFSTKGHMGTGLGLLVTRKLIEEHNGTIDMQSEPNKGTTFIVRIPFERVEGNLVNTDKH